MRFLISVCLLFGSGIIHTAFQSQSSPGARKLDSYGEIRHSEAEQWRLEDFLMPALSGDPQSKAYIIAYGAREDGPGKARRYALRAKNYLVNFRGIDPQRIVPVDGGRREEFVVELWIVPKDAKPPEPSPTITVSDDLNDNLYFDSFQIGYDNFGTKTEDGPARFEGFAAVLKKEPNSWGCIIAYAETGDDRIGFEWDPPGTGLRIAREQRADLVKNYKLPLSRLSVVDGGYAGRIVELWIMRPSAKSDSGPNIFPGRLKANRNGTLTIGGRNWITRCCRACIRKP